MKLRVIVGGSEDMVKVEAGRKISADMSRTQELGCSPFVSFVWFARTAMAAILCL